jgi:hypothetical protein
MALTLISTHTVDAACGCIDITSGIDSTYDSYEFHMVNMHPAADASLGFQVNAAGASGFNEPMTTTFFEAYNQESGATTPAVAYSTGSDQVDGDAAYQIVLRAQESDNDAGASGVLTLYAPSSTTYVKHFTSRGVAMHTDGGTDGNAFALDEFAAGYINVTAAIDEISFKFSTGNIDAGTIKMFGVS